MSDLHLDYLGNPGGDPVGYFAVGHIDDETFREAVRVKAAGEGWETELVDDSEVLRTWIVQRPTENGEMEIEFLIVPKEFKGAEPMTLIDLEEGEVRLQTLDAALVRLSEQTEGESRVTPTEQTHQLAREAEMVERVIEELLEVNTGKYGDGRTWAGMWPRRKRAADLIKYLARALSKAQMRAEWAADELVNLHLHISPPVSDDGSWWVRFDDIRHVIAALSNPADTGSPDA